MGQRSLVGVKEVGIESRKKSPQKGPERRTMSLMIQMVRGRD